MGGRGGERQSALAPPARFPCDQGRHRRGWAGTWRMAPPRSASPRAASRRQANAHQTASKTDTDSSSFEFHTMRIRGSRGSATPGSGTVVCTNARSVSSNFVLDLVYHKYQRNISIQPKRKARNPKQIEYCGAVLRLRATVTVHYGMGNTHRASNINQNRGWGDERRRTVLAIAYTLSRCVPPDVGGGTRRAVGPWVLGESYLKQLLSEVLL